MEELDAALVRDHMAGVELELVEMVEQQHTAETQGHTDDAIELQGKIDVLHAALAQTADIVADQAAADRRV
jgi:hypothetical protein